MTYFDHNATTPLFPAVAEKMASTLKSDWPNPSGPYRMSAVIRAKIERAREEIAGHFSACPSSLLFTSGATEAINTFLVHKLQVLDPNQKGLGLSFRAPRGFGECGTLVQAQG